MIKNRLLIAALAVLVFSGCSSKFDTILNSTDVDSKYASAFEYFNDGKFQKAAKLFESLSVQTNGTSKEDTVQYYWGLSNYRFKDFYTAETNFSKFITNFPRSPFTPEASFLRLDCLYRSTYRYELDQLPTRAAIGSIHQYLVDNPGNVHTDVCNEMLRDLNDRLDRKAFEGARLYYKMEDYQASRVAFRNILKDNAENTYREQILYYIAMSSYKFAHLSVAAKQRDRYLTFVDDYFNFIGEYPESVYRRELDVVYKRAQRAMGNNSVEDEDIDMSDRQFQKERKGRLKENETSSADGK
ncbi:MAG: outer membrane protein assembly factor BamD [Bacteroidales bacterium]|nr:outer membrane protein assembly factor BamD [Bacteroidales bacterium]MBQ4288014.1 outer membrane protein assembly factor BamD [Bacteroidales bacterium]